MSLVNDLRLATHVELTFPLGARVIVSWAGYLAMSAADLAGARARLLTRAEFIRRRGRAS